MFEKVIITDTYMRVLFEELHKYGYVDISDRIKELLGPHFRFGKVLRMDDTLRKNMKEIIYQTLLLSREIILYDPTNQIQSNYDLAKNKEFEFTFDVDDPPEYTIDENEYDYVDNYLAPSVLHNLHKNPYCPPTEIVKEILHHNTFDSMLSSYNAEWVVKIHTYAMDITKLHELSATWECPTLSKVYDLKTTGINYNQPIEDYALIKITCQDLIERLPSFDSLHEILKYRNNRKKDIKRFLSVMDEFSTTMKNDGQLIALQKLCADINKASREMARSTIAKPILSWTNVLLVPCTVVEKLLQLPPIGLSINVIVYLTKFVIEKQAQKYNWVDLIR